MLELKIEKMILGIVGTNCYYIYNEEERKALVFDPADNGSKIFESLANKNITPAAIFLTHGHFDHIMGVAKLKQLSKAPIYAYAKEAELLSSEDFNCSARTGKVVTVTPDYLLEDHETIEVAGIKIELLATPGHTAGSCCYFLEEQGILISGDTLFEASIGRTDLPTGSMRDIIHSIKSKLLILPPETVVYPGHGSSTTIMSEMKYNPFLG